MGIIRYLIRVKVGRGHFFGGSVSSSPGVTLAGARDSPVPLGTADKAGAAVAATAGAGLSLAPLLIGLLAPSPSPSWRPQPQPPRT